MRPQHGCTLRAHFHQLGEPPLVPLAPRGNATLKPMRFDLQLGIEALGSTRFFGIDCLHPRLIAAKADFVAAQASPVEPQRLACQPGQKGSVVADDHKGALVAGQPVLKPFDRPKIEVVGRLIEQQQVGFAGECPADGSTTAFAA